VNLIAPAQTIIGFFLTADRDVLILMLAVSVSLSVAICAILSRGRRWAELVGLFLLVLILSLSAFWVVFAYVVDIPFLKVETISVGTND